uniref:Pericentrin n=1 Tax=Erpetoichthys calabaricus TaxID=27687 RepID=A0A8C4SR13_ERPCA
MEKLKSTEEKIETQTRLIEEKEEIIQDLQQNLSHSTDAVSQLQCTVLEKEKEVSALKNEMLKFISSQDGHSLDQLAEGHEIDLWLQQKCNDIEVAQNLISSKELISCQLDKKFNTIQRESSQVEDQLKQLHEDLQVAEQQARESFMYNTEKDNLNTEVIRLNCIIEEMNLKLSDAEESYRQLKKKHEADVSSCENQLHLLEKEKQQAFRRLEESQETTQRLEEEISILRQEVVSKHDKHDNQENCHLQDIENFKEKLNEIKAKKAVEINEESNDSHLSAVGFPCTDDEEHFMNKYLTSTQEAECSWLKDGASMQSGNESSEHQQFELNSEIFLEENMCDSFGDIIGSCNLIQLSLPDNAELGSRSSVESFGSINCQKNACAVIKSYDGIDVTDAENTNTSELQSSTMFSELNNENVKQFQMELNTLAEKVLDLQDSKQQMSEELSALQLKLKIEEEERARCEEIVRLKSQECEDLKTTLNNKMLHHDKNENLETAFAIQELNDLKKERDFLLMQLRDQEELVKEVQQRKLAGDSVASEVQALFGRQLAVLQTQRDQLQSELDIQKSKNQTTSELLGERTLLVDSLRNELCLLKRENSDRDHILKILEDEKRDLEAKLHSVEQNHIRASDAFNQCNREKLDLEKNLADLDVKVKNLENIMESEKLQLKSQLNDKSVDLQNLEEQMKHSQLEYIQKESGLREEIAWLKSRIEDLEKAHNKELDVLPFFPLSFKLFQVHEREHVREISELVEKHKDELKSQRLHFLSEQQELKDRLNEAHLIELDQMKLHALEREALRLSLTNLYTAQLELSQSNLLQEKESALSELRENLNDKRSQEVAMLQTRHHFEMEKVKGHYSEIICLKKLHEHDLETAKTSLEEMKKILSEKEVQIQDLKNHESTLLSRMNAEKEQAESLQRMYDDLKTHSDQEIKHLWSQLENTRTSRQELGELKEQLLARASHVEDIERLKQELTQQRLDLKSQHERELENLRTYLSKSYMRQETVIKRKLLIFIIMELDLLRLKLEEKHLNELEAQRSTLTLKFKEDLLNMKTDLSDRYFAEIQELKTKHSLELEQLRARLSDSHIKDDLKQKVDEARKEESDKAAKILSEKDAELKQLQDELQSASEERITAIQVDLSKIAEQEREALVKEFEARELELKALQNKQEAIISELEKELKEERNQLQKLQDSLDGKQSSKIMQHENIQTEFDDELDISNSKIAEEMTLLKSRVEESQFKLEEAQNRFTEEKKLMADQLDKSLRELEAAQAEELEMMRRFLQEQHHKELVALEKELTAKHQIKMETVINDLQSAHRTRLQEVEQDLCKKHTMEMKEMENRFLSNIDTLESTYLSQIQSLRKEHDQTVNIKVEHEAQMISAMEQLKKELSMIHMEKFKAMAAEVEKIMKIQFKVKITSNQVLVFNMYLLNSFSISDEVQSQCSEGESESSHWSSITDKTLRSSQLLYESSIASPEQERENHILLICDRLRGTVEKLLELVVESALQVRIISIFRNIIIFENLSVVCYYSGCVAEKAALEEVLQQTIKKEHQLAVEVDTLRERLHDLSEEHNLLVRRSEAMAATMGDTEAGLLEEANRLAKEKLDLQCQAEKDRCSLTNRLKILENELEDQMNSNTELEDKRKTEVTDLKQQILALEKQLRNNRQFMDDQAVEREHERDEFQQEIKKLETQLKQQFRSNTGMEYQGQQVETLQETIKKKTDEYNILLLAKEQTDNYLTEQLEETEKLASHIRELEENVLSNAEATRKVIQLEQEIQRLKKSEMELMEYKEALQQQQYANRMQISALQTKLDETRHRIPEDHSDQVLKQQIEAKHESLVNKEKENAILINQIEHLERDLLSKSEELIQINIQLGLQAKTNTSKKYFFLIYKDIITNLQEHRRIDPDSTSSVMQLPQALLEEKNQEIDHLNDQLLRLQQEHELNNKMLEEKNSEAEDMKSQIERYVGDLDRLRQDKADEVERLHEVIYKLQEEIDQLGPNCHEISDSQEDLPLDRLDNRGSLQHELWQEERLQQELATEHIQLSDARVKELEQQMENACIERETLQQLLQKQEAHFRSEMEKLGKSLQNEKLQHHSLQEEYNLLKAHLTEQEAEAAHLSTKTQELEDLLRERECQLVEAEVQAKGTEEKRQAEILSLKHLPTEKSLLNAQLLELNEIILRKTGEIEMLQNEVVKLQTHIEEIGSEKGQLFAESTDLKQKMLSLNDEVDRLKTEVTTKNAQIQDFLIQLEDNQTKHSGTERMLNCAEESLAKTETTLKERAQQLQEYVCKISELKTELEELKVELMTVKEQLCLSTIHADRLLEERQVCAYFSFVSEKDFENSVLTPCVSPTGTATSLSVREWVSDGYGSSKLEEIIPSYKKTVTAFTVKFSIVWNLLQKVYHEARLVLSLSEEYGSYTKPSINTKLSDIESWQVEKQALQEILQSLKEMISKMLDHSDKSVIQSSDWRREILQAVHSVLNNETEWFRAELQSTLQGSGCTDITTLLEKFESIMSKLEEKQNAALGNLLAADRRSMLVEIQTLQAELRISHLQNQERLQQLQSSLSHTEEQGNKREHQLRRQGTELLKYKLQQEQAIVNDLQDSLKSEQDRSAELRSHFRSEQDAVADLKRELLAVNQTLETSLKKEHDLQKELENLRCSCLSGPLLFCYSHSTVYLTSLEDRNIQNNQLCAALEQERVISSNLRKELQIEQSRCEALISQERNKLAEAQQLLQIEKTRSYELSDAVKREQQRLAQEYCQKLKEEAVQRVEQMSQDQNLIHELQMQVNQEKDRSLELACMIEKTQQQAIQAKRQMESEAQQNMLELKKAQELVAKLQKSVETLQVQKLNLTQGFEREREQFTERLRSEVDKLQRKFLSVKEKEKAREEQMEKQKKQYQQELHAMELQHQRDQQRLIQLQQTLEELEQHEKELASRKQKQEIFTSEFATPDIQTAEKEFSQANTSSVLASERAAWQKEKAFLTSALNKAESELARMTAENENRPIGDSSSKLTESFRKALVYQKKYLLLLLGGFQDTEREILSLIARMGVYPSPKDLQNTASTSRPISKFRSAVRVLIAISRTEVLRPQHSTIIFNSPPTRENVSFNRSTHIVQSPKSPYKLQNRSHEQSITSSQDAERSLTEYIHHLEAVQQRLGGHKLGEQEDSIKSICV